MGLSVDTPPYKDVWLKANLAKGSADDLFAMLSAIDLREGALAQELRQLLQQEGTDKAQLGEQCTRARRFRLGGWWGLGCRNRRAMQCSTAAGAAERAPCSSPPRAPCMLLCARVRASGGYRRGGVQVCIRGSPWAQARAWRHSSLHERSPPCVCPLLALQTSWRR